MKKVVLRKKARLFSFLLQPMNRYAVIVAGGSGSRMGTTTPKQFLALRQMPLLWHTLHAFTQVIPASNIIVVVPEAYLNSDTLQWIDAAFGAAITLVTGGETRFHSVKNGLSKVPNDALVAVHDAVRCLITPALIEACFVQAATAKSAIPAISSVDSVRLQAPDGSNQMLNRNQVMLIQTPQTFHSTLLKQAFEQPYNDTFTDEASVVEAIGASVQLIPGETTNLKVTRPLDLVVAEYILQERTENFSE
jgi:2-C-methyl-D-erythritol 4-phosphate cytidylyltransferase